MDIAWPKNQDKIIVQRKGKGKVKMEEGELMWLAEDVEEFHEE